MVTLYKKDSKGKIRILQLSTTFNTLIQESGLIDGKLVENRRICKPKNVGKINATTAEEQAKKELLAIVEKKLQEGYFATKEETLQDKVLLPMLADKVDVSTLVFPVFVQPKLDGMRSISVESKLISRKNRTIETLDHIIDELKTHHKLDGELYAHGLSFQENMKLIKKKREESIHVKYHVYDLHGSTESFSKRYELLQEIVKDMTHVEIVPTHKVETLEDLQAFHQIFLEQGYEGTIVRLDDTGYEYNKRSKSLLKFKDFIDEAYEIVDIVPSDKIPTHGVVMCKIDNTTFKCGMKVSHDEREKMLSNKESYIGKTAEVRFFEFTDGGIPRFPVFVGIRLDK